VADNQAIYGVGRYGVAVYGEIPVAVPVSGVAITATNIGSVSVYGDANTVPQSVQASATADTDVVITADATHTLVSVSAAFAQGSVGVVGVAIHQVDGVEATATNNTAVISADSNYTTTSVQASTFVGGNTVKASATALPTGVLATGVVDVSGEGFKVYSRVIVEVVGVADSSTEIGEVVVTADAISVTTAEGSSGVVGDTVVVAKALTITESVDATASVNDVAQVIATALTLPDGSFATGTADSGSVVIADANLTLVSVEGVVTNGGVGEVNASAVADEVVGVFATGSVNDVADIIATATVIPESAQASVTADTDIIISGDSNHTLISVQGIVANGGVGQVTAAATISSDFAVEAIGFVSDDLYFIAEANVTPPAAISTGEVGSTTIVGESNLTLLSVPLSVTAGDAVVEADAIMSVFGVEALPQLDENTVVVAKALQTVEGFALVLSKTDPDVATTTTIFYPDAFAKDRVAYVYDRDNSNDRTAVVPASEDRTAYVEADYQSRTIKIAA